MTTPTPELCRLSEIAPGTVPPRVMALIRSAKAAPEEELPRLRWRLRASLRQRATQRRPRLRILLITGSVFLAGGVVGAAVGRLGVPSPPQLAKAERPTPATRAPVVRRSTRAPDPGIPPAFLADPPENRPIGDPVSASPPRSLPRPARLPRRAATDLLPDPPVRPAEAVPVAPPSPVAVEQALLADMLKALRQQHDPRSALALIDDHEGRFPQSALAPEVAMLRAEALLGLGRHPEALAVLDRLALAAMPNRGERLVLRGELRANAGRWREARDDFEIALASTSSAHERNSDVTDRALWGRASARSRLGDSVGARADLELYLRRFPQGRFAAQAATLLEGAP